MKRFKLMAYRQRKSLSSSEEEETSQQPDSFLERIRRCLRKRPPKSVELEAQFEASARELIAACRDCCDTTDEFIAFLSAFLSELCTMHHALNNLMNMPMAAPDWSIDRLLTEQVPTVQAAIVSVTGQVAAREHMLANNIEVIANLHQAFEKVKAQVSVDLILEMIAEIEPLLKRTNQQMLSIRSITALIADEKVVYDGFAQTVSSEGKPTLLN